MTRDDYREHLRRALERMTAARAVHEVTREAHIKAQVAVKEAEIYYRQAERDYINASLSETA